MWGSLKKVGIFSKNVGIIEEKNGGDLWGFLIAEVGISTLNFLAALIRSKCSDTSHKSNVVRNKKKDLEILIINRTNMEEDLSVL